MHYTKRVVPTRTSTNTDMVCFAGIQARGIQKGIQRETGYQTHDDGYLVNDRTDDPVRKTEVRRQVLRTRIQVWTFCPCSGYQKEVNSSEDPLTAVNERLRRCWWCALVKACQRNSVYHRVEPPATRENACDECYRVGEQVRKAEVRTEVRIFGANSACVPSDEF